MALTITTTNNPGNFPYTITPSPALGPALKVWAGSINGDASYPTGGSVVTPSLFGMTAVYAIGPLGSASNSNVVSNVAGKLKFFVATTGVEVANTTDLSAVTAEVLVIGV